ncbi:TetR/AcrR family transcriptional regulator [Corynebacterium ureicelerivorans]
MNHVVPGRRSDSTDPRAIRTRNALVQATIGLLKTHTVAELNVSQIVKEAGVSRQVFY